SAQPLRSRDHRAGDPELRAADRRAVREEARVLLLPAADAPARRGTPHAGRVRAREGRAEGRGLRHDVLHLLRSRGPERRLMGATAMAEPDPHQPAPRKAGPLDVAKAVFWSFFGIRRRAAHERDAVTLKPAQVIVAGIIGAII